MTAQDQAALLAHVSVDGDKEITFDELELFLGIPPGKKEKDQAKKHKEEEEIKRKQHRPSLAEEPLSSFLELERHGRKPFRWYDDE